VQLENACSWTSVERQCYKLPKGVRDDVLALVVSVVSTAATPCFRTLISSVKPPQTHRWLIKTPILLDKHARNVNTATQTRRLTHTPLHNLMEAMNRVVMVILAMEDIEMNILMVMTTQIRHEHHSRGLMTLRQVDKHQLRRNSKQVDLRQRGGGMIFSIRFNDPILSHKLSKDCKRFKKL
jgi:hypothetical protein